MRTRTRNTQNRLLTVMCGRSSGGSVLCSEVHHSVFAFVFSAPSLLPSALGPVNHLF